jgi:hypothetical protein
VPDDCEEDTADTGDTGVISTETGLGEGTGELVLKGCSCDGGARGPGSVVGFMALLFLMGRRRQS